MVLQIFISCRDASRAASGAGAAASEKLMSGGAKRRLGGLLKKADKRPANRAVAGSPVGAKITAAILLAGRQAGLLERVVPKSYMVLSNWFQDQRETHHLNRLAWDTVVRGCVDRFASCDVCVCVR